MTPIDLDHLRTWIGKSRADDDVIAARHARLMAATVDYPHPEHLRDGEPLPPLWHWIYFLEGLPPGELGRDGTRRAAVSCRRCRSPTGCGPAAACPSLGRCRSARRCARNRASSRSITRSGGRRPGLRHGAARDQIAGRRPARPRGARHRLQGNITAVTPRAAPPPSPEAGSTRTFVPTSTTLFRYSALTFNGHRIHYDQDYCRTVEGYANLVVHGPLTATMLAAFAEEASGRTLREFSYRGVRPALLGDALTLSASLEGDHASLAVRLGDGAICMQADAAFADPASGRGA